MIIYKQVRESLDETENGQLDKRIESFLFRLAEFAADSGLK